MSIVDRYRQRLSGSTRAEVEAVLAHFDRQARSMSAPAPAPASTPARNATTNQRPKDNNMTTRKATLYRPRGASSTLYSDTGAQTVGGLLKQPRVITELIASSLADRSLTSVVFGDATADATGGAVLYQSVSPSDLATVSDVHERTEGAEYGLVTLPEPKIERDPVEDLGGKFAMTDEARDRNIVPMMQNGLSQLQSTIGRKLDARTVAVLDAAAEQNSLDIAAATEWSNFTTIGQTPTPLADTPLADLLTVQETFDQDEMGVQIERVLLNPSDAAALKIGYGAQLSDMLAAVSGDLDKPIRLVTSARIGRGTAYVLGDRNPGGLGVEVPLTTEVIDKRENRSTLVQSYIVARPFVSRSYAVRRITGISA